jgi:hypothetical protein
MYIQIMSGEPSFQDINFGLADGYREFGEHPILIKKGFLDKDNWLEQLIDGPKFLVLGPKGSGKTALGIKLFQKCQEESKRWRGQYQFLSNFPFQKFTGVIHNRESLSIKYVENWDYLLLINLFNQIYHDDIGNLYPEQYQNLIELLIKLGFIPNNDLSSIVETNSEIKWGIGLKDMIWVETKKSEVTKDIPINPNFLLEKMRRVAKNVSCSIRYFFIIDGLDDVLTTRDNQYESLMALILSTSRLNDEFKTCHVPVKYILLCRSQLFDSLKNPNKNKIAQDCSFELEWRYDSANIYNSDLVKLVNLRASIGLQKEINIFEQYFPSKIFRRDRAVKTILDHTRNTPRDLIQLLKIIQDVNKHTTKLTPEGIKLALKEYSENYFVREIKDELTGFIDNTKVDLLIDLLMSMNSFEFSYDLLKEKLKERKFKDIDLDSSLKALFMCSAIGNVKTIDMNQNFTFKYRNKHSNLNLDEKIVVHRGLIRGLNLPY